MPPRLARAPLHRPRCVGSYYLGLPSRSPTTRNSKKSWRAGELPQPDAPVIPPPQPNRTKPTSKAHTHVSVPALKLLVCDSCGNTCYPGLLFQLFSRSTRPPSEPKPKPRRLRTATRSCLQRVDLPWRPAISRTLLPLQSPRQPRRRRPRPLRPLCARLRRPQPLLPTKLALLRPTRRLMMRQARALISVSFASETLSVHVQSCL